MSDEYTRHLAELPRGDPAAGEIELLVDPAERAAVQAAAAAALRARGLPEAWAHVGEVLRDQYLVVYRDAVAFPGGARGTYLRIAPADSPEHPRGVQIVVWLDGGYLLLHNYRHATRRWEWAFPRGFVPAGVDPAAHARTELAEELGPVEVRAARLLGCTAPDSGLQATLVEHWLVELAAPPRSVGTRAEAHEAIRGARVLPPEAFWAEMAAGTLTDGLTLTGFALAEAAARPLRRPPDVHPG